MNNTIFGQRRLHIPLLLLVILGQPQEASSAEKEALELPGTVVPAQLVRIIPNVSGQVAELRAEAGSVVKKGEVLATLNPSKYKLKLEHAQAKLELIKARQAELKAAQGEGVKLSAVADAELKLAESELRITKYELESTEVRAPIDGTVLRRRAEVGTVIDPMVSGDRIGDLFEIADLRMLEVSVDVSEATIHHVSLGQRCRIQLVAPKADYEGEVVRIEPVADSSTRTFRVQVKLQQSAKPPLLRPGSYVRVHISQ